MPDYRLFPTPPAKALEILFRRSIVGETVVLKPRWGAGSAGITILHSKDDLSTLATKPEFIQNVHSNQYYLEEYCSGSVYHVDVVYINADSILISPSRYLVPPLDFEKQNTGSVMLDEDDADYSELLRLTKQLIRSFKDQTIPNVMHIEFYKNETGDFIFGEMAARRGGGLIKQELTAAYGMDQSKANFLLELGLVDADTNITRLSQYGILLETAGLNWPKEKEIPDWAVLESVGKKKGISLVGTGDFTHPAWREELKEKLVPAESGLYRLRDEYVLEEAKMLPGGAPRFVITGEISSIYKKNGKCRKVHNVLLLSGLEEADKIAGRLEKIGNIHSDGRPILGLDCHDLLEILLENCADGMLVPAHIWTPHFGLFGAASGFDTMEECFEDLTSYVHAVETGFIFRSTYELAFICT